MHERDLSIAKTLKEKLSEHVALVDLRVFGSRAKGVSDEYSDMDVFIEVEKLDQDIREKIFDIVWEVGFAHGIIISPIICSRKEVENTPFRASPILKNIYQEGYRI